MKAKEKKYLRSIGKPAIKKPSGKKNPAGTKLSESIRSDDDGYKFGTLGLGRKPGMIGRFFIERRKDLNKTLIKNNEQPVHF